MQNKTKRPWSAIGLAALLLALLNIAVPTRAQDATPPTAPQAAQHQTFIPMVSVPEALSSEQLIDRAYSAGTLDLDTAVRYHLFAAFGDARLPAAYHGADSSDVSAAPEIAGRLYSQLSPATQQIAQPFLLRPDAAGSWDSSSAGQQLAGAQEPPLWATTCQTSANIKVWYHPKYAADASTAHSICELVDGTIWPKLLGLMGHAPLSDAGDANSGGDGRFDIYLVSATSSLGGSFTTCGAHSAYMLVNRAAVIRSQLADLLMRAILRGYSAGSCDDYMWLYEATSVWARDFVFPGDNTEQSWAPAFLNAAGRPLDEYFHSGDDMLVPLGPGNADRGAYLWPFYLARVLGQPQLISSIWANSSNPDSLAVVNSAIPGSFKEQFPKFNLANWNRAPQLPYAADSLAPGLKPLLDQSAALGGQPTKLIALDGAVKYLAAHAFHFTFSDPQVRTVLFNNRYGENDLKTAHIDALLKIGGTWKQEDWSAGGTQQFCRDLSAERIDELVLIVNNTEFANRSHTLSADDSPQLMLSNMACRGWTIDAKAVTTRVGPNVNLTEEITTKATFQRVADAALAGTETYYTTSGTANWDHYGTLDGCVGQRMVSLPVNSSSNPSGSNNQLWMQPYGLDVQEYTGVRSYTLSGAVAQALAETVTYTCPNDRPAITATLLNGAWALSGVGLDFQHAGADGQKISGTYTQAAPPESNGTTMTTVYTWTLTALPAE